MADIDIDDLMNDLNNTQSTKKGKGKKGKAKGKEEEPVKQEVKEEQSTTKLPEPVKESKTEPEPSKKENKPEVKTQEKEIKEEAKDEDNEEGVEDGAQEGVQESGQANDGEKKKKVVKKVIVKKGAKNKKEDMFLKLAKEQVKLNKQLEEESKKAREEEERRIREEEEKLRKEEEEKRKKEEEEALEKARRKEEMKRLNLTEKEYFELLRKKEETLKKLKEEGINSIEELTKVSVPAFKPKKKKHVVAKKENDNHEKDEEDGLDENLRNRKISMEEREKVVVKDNTEVDDWENEVEDDNQGKTRKQSNVMIEESEHVVVKKEVKQVNKNHNDDDDEKKDTEKKMRSPIICILGHVDTGKTKLLDKLRNTNVQKGEAGGITQQIGATTCPLENLLPIINKIQEKEHKLQEIKLPGLLIIDTPGHASFQNLRVRGQSLCDIAIVVVDIMHGLELQTIDSLRMLKEKKTPFLIAFNKIDQIYGWVKYPWDPFRDSFKKQSPNVQHEFNNNFKKIQTQIIKEVGLNTALYYENENMREYLNIIPTSAITGEGMPDLINMCLYFSQTYMPKKLTFKKNVECSVLEVKVIEKVGTTIDIVLVNGYLKMGNKIVVAGLNGPIKTEIKYILTPQPMKELRVKSEYVHHKEVMGSVGCKIFALNLEEALAGSPLHVYHSEKEADELCQEIKDDCLSFLSDDMFNKEGRGVLCVASSLGSLEAIMSYLQEEKIPVAGVNLGYVQKKDVIKILTIHNKEKDKKKEILKEDLCLLAFDVHVNKDAQEYADKNGVTILTADIIYHLKDKYRELEEKCFDERKKEKMKEAIFPCRLKIIPKAIFNRIDPVIVGVNILDGILKKDTPIYCVEKKKVLGVIESIQKEKKEQSEAFKNNDVSIRIKTIDKHVGFKTHFDEGDTLVANLSRQSIDRLKEYFYEDLVKNPDWVTLIKEIKEVLEIGK